MDLRRPGLPAKLFPGVMAFATAGCGRLPGPGTVWCKPLRSSRSDAGSQPSLVFTPVKASDTQDVAKERGWHKRFIYWFIQLTNTRFIEPLLRARHGLVLGGTEDKTRSVLGGLRGLTAWERRFRQRVGQRPGACGSVCGGPWRRHCVPLSPSRSTSCKRS